VAVAANPIVKRGALARRMKALRRQAGLTLEASGREIEVSAATMSRIEKGDRVPRIRDVRDLARLYGASPVEVQELVALANSAKEPAWWENSPVVDERYERLIGMEAAATAVDEHRNSVIPGLMQTEGYVRAYLQEGIDLIRDTPYSNKQLNDRVDVVRRRQEILSSGQLSSYSAFLDEGCVRRLVGGTAVMADQVRALLELISGDRISIRIIPFSHGAHAGQSSGFEYLTLPREEMSDVVYVDSLAGQDFYNTQESLARYRKVLTALDERALNCPESKKFLASAERALRA
jgi:transcriptional regulator with XRE-family HTH domain